MKFSSISTAAAVLLCLSSACSEHEGHVAHAQHKEHTSHDTHAQHEGHTKPGAKPDTKQDAQKAAENPVQHEMILLTAALSNAVRAIGAGDVRSVAHDLHRVHAAKEATEAALHEGRYKLKKNPERLARFVELDQAFHRELEKLVAASRRNDVAATAEALGGVMKGCQGCHGEFRP